MFNITPYNKILLSIGDTAALNVQIVDMEGEEYIIGDDDNLVLSVFTADEILLRKEADIENGVFVFNLVKEDTINIKPGIYDYNIILNPDGEQSTVIHDSIFELCGGMPQEIEPTPEQDIDLDPDPVDSSDIIVFGNPVCYEGDTITVKMRVKLMASAIDLKLAYDSQHLQMTGYSGGLGNTNITYNANSITINDYCSTGANIAEYQFNFKTLAAGSGYVRVSELNEITDENGNPYMDIYGIGQSLITIKERPSASSEARLQSLTISPGTWNKAFDPDATDYTISITSSDTELSLQYTTMDSNATVAYWPYSEAGKLVIDTEGENEFTIRCTAQDGRTTVDYHITVLILT